MAGEENYEAMKAAVMATVGTYFRPEFINRIDETVVFHPLGQEEIRIIARIQLEHLVKRLAERDLTMEISAAALDELGQVGFDPVYGARPLKREIQQSIENPLAQALLGGQFGPGDHIKIDVNEDKVFEFRR
jgi:ATP-dependent Clp protease ATP-binding subunit ClpB